MRIVCVLLLCSLAAQADKIAIHRPPDSPVAVSNASTHDLLGNGIKVRNRSQKTIRKVTVEIRRRNPGGPDSVTREEQIVKLAPDETGSVRIPYQPGASEVTITVVAVEYADGSTWAVPRT